MRLWVGQGVEQQRSGWSEAGQGTIRQQMKLVQNESSTTVTQMPLSNQVALVLWLHTGVQPIFNRERSPCKLNL